MVIGGVHSNNTHELVKTCLKHCPRVHHVQSVDDLKPDWFAGANIVGLTAGTSTPDSCVDAVEAWLRALGTNKVEHDESDALRRLSSHGIEAA